MGIKDENWLMHKLKLDPTLKDTMEEVGYTNGKIINSIFLNLNHSNYHYYLILLLFVLIFL
jgi:hypothetical protein